MCALDRARQTSNRTRGGELGTAGLRGRTTLRRPMNLNRVMPAEELRQVSEFLNRQQLGLAVFSFTGFFVGSTCGYCEWRAHG